MGPRTPQSHREQRLGLAALEAHDADIPTADQASSNVKGEHAVTGHHIPSFHHEPAPPTSSASEAAIPANSYPNPPIFHDLHNRPVDQVQPEMSDNTLAPSTIAQWSPPRHSEITPTVPIISPSTSPATAPISAPEVLQSPDQEIITSTLPGTATSSTPETIHTSANEQTSPTSAELDKEVDLEAGNRRSSSSSKTEVKAAEQAVSDPNIVNWDGSDDPQNPMNWSAKLKWGNVAVIASITFLTWVHCCYIFRAHTD